MCMRALRSQGCQVLVVHCSPRLWTCRGAGRTGKTRQRRTVDGMRDVGGGKRASIELAQPLDMLQQRRRRGLPQHARAEGREDGEQVQCASAGECRVDVAKRKGLGPPVSRWRWLAQVDDDTLQGLALRLVRRDGGSVNQCELPAPDRGTVQGVQIQCQCATASLLLCPKGAHAARWRVLRSRRSIRKPLLSCSLPQRSHAFP